jgi:PAS domain S-box-containing protein
VVGFAPRKCLRQVHPEDRSRVARAYQRCRHDGVPFAIEHRICLPDGLVRTVFARGAGARDPGGDRIVRMFGTVQDITEARVAEAALKDAQERYRLLVETSPDAILVQQDRKIVFANPAALRLLGATQQAQVVGRSIPDFLGPDFQDCCEHTTARDTSRTGSPLEAKLVRTDQSQIAFQAPADDTRARQYH